LNRKSASEFCDRDSFPYWQAKTAQILSEKLLVPIDRSVLDRLPLYAHAGLATVIIVLPTLESIQELETSLQRWTTYPPCLVDSFPVKQGSSHVDLVFVLSQAEAKVQLKEVLEKVSLNCFRSIKLMLRSSQQDLLPDLLQSLHVTAGPGYALILKAYCAPIQANWLNLLDQQTRPPVDAFWLRGSIFQGHLENPPYRLSPLLRPSDCGLYNLWDRSFYQFLMERVTRNVTIAPSPQEMDDWWTGRITGYLADLDGSEMDFWQVLHRFHHTDAVLDYARATHNVSISHLHRLHPDTALACTPRLVD